MLKQKYFLADIFILSAEKQPIKLSWRKIEWLQRLQAENLRLRAENALLKKAKALVEAKKAQALLNGREPSTN